MKTIIEKANSKAGRWGTLSKLGWKYTTWKLAIRQRNPVRIDYVSTDKITRVTAPDPNVDIHMTDYPEDYPHGGSKRGIFKYKRAGDVVGGEWDTNTVEVKDLPELIGIQQLLQENKDIREIPYFQQCADYISSGYEAWGYQNTETFYRNRPDDLSNLAESIRQNGVLSQKEINGISWPLDEISVNIGRNGDPIFNSKGHHRLGIAKILGVDEIPVIVIVRHPQWVDSNSDHTL